MKDDGHSYDGEDRKMKYKPLLVDESKNLKMIFENKKLKDELLTAIFGKSQISASDFTMSYIDPDTLSESEEWSETIIKPDAAMLKIPKRIRNKPEGCHLPVPRKTRPSKN